MATLIKPPRLRPGDTIGICSPASAPHATDAFPRAVAAVEALGFRAKLAPHARQRLGFLAGSDAERAADLMSLFADAQVRAIICMRGGYGSARLLARLDFAVLRRHPKIFVGYSDITSLHCALHVQAGLVSFHGPSLDGGLARPDFPAFTRQSLFKAIMETAPTGPLSAGCDAKTAVTVRGGRATGALIGGNLSILVTKLGTPWMPDLRGKILFLEDVDEKPYRYDRMLTHLLNAGVLQTVAGVAVGLNALCVDPKAETAGEYRQTIQDVLQERLGGLGVPVVMDLPFGHVPLNATLPVGLPATLDGNAAELIIEEAAVTD